MTTRSNCSSFRICIACSCVATASTIHPCERRRAVLLKRKGGLCATTKMRLVDRKNIPLHYPELACVIVRHQRQRCGCSIALMSSQYDLTVYGILHAMLLSLVDAPCDLTLELVPTFDGANFRIDAPGQNGRLIGRQGQTARSLRTLLELFGQRGKRVYTLDIAGSPRLPFPAPILPKVA
jgi:predicted RNA-binding protein YlqC (UPF0109 family)